MGLLRRNDEPGGTRYQMREKLFAIGDDSWIENQNGERAFKLQPASMRARHTARRSSAALAQSR